MKQSDIITVVMIAVIGTIASFALVNLMLGNPDDFVVEYKTVSAVNDNLSDPDPEVFNYGSINPTVEIWVGDCDASDDTDGDGRLSKEEVEACEHKGEEPEPEPEPTPEPTPEPEG